MIPTPFNTIQCRICGSFLGRYHSYVLGIEQCLSQCADAGPCHRDCATKEAEADAGASGELRAVWTTKHRAEAFRDEANQRILGRIVSVHSVAWITPDGKPATYAEIEAAFAPAIEAAQAKATSEDEINSLVNQIATLHQFMPRRTTP